MFNPNSPRGVVAVNRALNPEHLALILGVMIKNRNLFVKVKSSLTPELLDRQGEEFHAAFLKVAYGYFDQNSELPLEQALVANLVSISRDSNSGFYEGIVSEEVRRIYRITEGESEETIRGTERYVNTLIEELLIDRRVINPTRNRLISVGDASLANPSQILNDANENLLEIRRILNRTSVSSVPQMRRRTHAYVEFDHDMDFLNAITKGGLPRKSVSGLLGPFGSCKTTTATQAAASRINVEWRRYQRGEPAQLVVYANCEGDPEEISFRVLSFLAKIPVRMVRSHYYQETPLRDYIPDDPDDYNNKYGMALPETVRLAEACEKVDKFLKIIDASGGQATSTNIGKNFVDDLSVAVDEFCRESGMTMSLFILDYAKAFTRRYMDLNKIAADSIRHYLGKLPDVVRSQIADKYDCAAIVLQQMNKNANTQKPGKLLTHGDSSEASDFGENCWFCFCLSVPDKTEDGKFRTNINMSKARDVEPPRRMPSLEYLPYCQGLRLSDDFRIVNNNLIYEENRTVMSAVSASSGPSRRGSSSRASANGVTSNALNPFEGA
jgi:hypothetical protein